MSRGGYRISAAQSSETASITHSARSAPERRASAVTKAVGEWNGTQRGVRELPVPPVTAAAANAEVGGALLRSSPLSGPLRIGPREGVGEQRGWSSLLA
jgi:hypothetical protein